MRLSEVLYPNNPPINAISVPCPLYVSLNEPYNVIFIFYPEKLPLKEDLLAESIL